MDIKRIIGLACALGVFGSFAVDAECMKRWWEYNLETHAAHRGRLSPEIEALIARADKGDARAQFELGHCYQWGIGGVAKDHKTAVTWFTMAAAQGNAHAQFRLGDCYECGFGIEKDTEEALKWYREAAQGLPWAKRALARLTEILALFTAENRLTAERAAEQARKADLAKLNLDLLPEQAEAGDAKAQFWLGWCYEDGVVGGVAKDTKTAVMWFKRAAEQGHTEAQFELGYRYFFGAKGVEKDSEEAVKWFTMAAEQEHPRAQFWLGWCYEYGDGVDQDTATALHWYQQAAERGHEGAMERLNKLQKQVDNK